MDENEVTSEAEETTAKAVGEVESSSLPGVLLVVVLLCCSIYFHFYRKRKKQM